MLRVAHRGGMGKGYQNSPAGIRLAISQAVDCVELDVVRGRDGTFQCGHGFADRTMLEDCLAEVGESLDLILHLKGRFAVEDLLALVEQVRRNLPLDRVMFAAHSGGVLCRLHDFLPSARLARFGLVPAIRALWRRPVWGCCLVNQVVLTKALVLALQSRGCSVYASCVWEFRSRESVGNLSVDGAFVNLREK